MGCLTENDKNYLKDGSNACSNKYSCNLSAVDYMGIKKGREKKNWKLNESFYKTVFIEDDHELIDLCVNQFTIFFLVIKDTNELILTRSV